MADRFSFEDAQERLAGGGRRLSFEEAQGLVAPMPSPARPARTQQAFTPLPTIPRPQARQEPQEPQGYVPIPEVITGRGEPRERGVAAQSMAEVVKGVPGGAVSGAGTAVTGAGALTQGRMREVLNVLDRIDRGEQVPETEDPIGYQHMPPELRAQTRTEIEAVARQPLEETPLVQRGREITEAGREMIPAAPGYEQSVGRQLGAGLGTMVAGAGVSGVTGPVGGATLFGLMGAGEATERALQEGASEEDVIASARAGVIPGLTDSLPIELLLGRVPIPGVGRIKVSADEFGRAMKALGRIGMQAFVEGIQEGGQEFLQNLIARETYKPDQELGEDIVPATGLGAGVGAIAETGRQAIQNFAGRRARGPVPWQLEPGTGEQARPPEGPEEDLERRFEEALGEVHEEPDLTVPPPEALRPGQRVSLEDAQAMVSGEATAEAQAPLGTPERTRENIARAARISPEIVQRVLAREGRRPPQPERPRALPAPEVEPEAPEPSPERPTPPAEQPTATEPSPARPETPEEPVARPGTAEGQETAADVPVMERAPREPQTPEEMIAEANRLQSVLNAGQWIPGWVPETSRRPRKVDDQFAHQLRVRISDLRRKASASSPAEPAQAAPEAAEPEIPQPTRHFQRYTPEQRANLQASFRQGHRGRERVGEAFWTHPWMPDVAFPTKKRAMDVARERGQPPAQPAAEQPRPAAERGEQEQRLVPFTEYVAERMGTRRWYVGKGRMGPRLAEKYDVRITPKQYKELEADWQRDHPDAAAQELRAVRGETQPTEGEGRTRRAAELAAPTTETAPEGEQTVLPGAEQEPAAFRVYEGFQRRGSLHRQDDRSFVFRGTNGDTRRYGSFEEARGELERLGLKVLEDPDTAQIREAAEETIRQEVFGEQREPQAGPPGSQGATELYAGIPLGHMWDHLIGPFFERYYEPLGKIPGGRKSYLAPRYRAQGRATEMDELAGELFNRINRHDAATKEQIYQYLTTADAAPSMVTDARARNDATVAKKLIDIAGRELVHRGVLEQGQYDKYKDRYLPRIYLKYLFQTPDVQIGAGNRPVPPSALTGSLKRRKDIPQFERDILLGEVKDPAYLVARAFGTAAHSIAIFDLYDKIADNPQWVYPNSLVLWRGRKVTTRWLRAEAQRLRDMEHRYPDEHKPMVRRTADDMDRVAREAGDEPSAATSEYRQIPDSKRYGVLRGLWVRKEIYDDLVGSADPQFTDENFRWLSQKARMANSLWKGMKTAWSISGQARNFVSGGIQAHMFGEVPLVMVPERALEAMHDMATNGRYWQTAKDYGVKSTSFAQSELLQVHDEFKQKLALKHYKSNPYRLLREMASRMNQRVGNLYSLNEQFWKTTVLLHHMKRGMPAEDAVLKAQDAVFDYSLVPNWVRFLRRWAFGAPFLTFGFKSLPRALETALKRPWAYVPYVGLTYGSMMLLQYLNDLDDDDVEKLKELLPEWLDHGLVVWLPGKDEHGRWQPVDMAYTLPWGGWWQFFHAVGTGRPNEAMMELGLGGAPLFSMATALIGNKDRLGREVYDPGEPTWRQVMSMAGYIVNHIVPPWAGPQGQIMSLIQSIRGTPTRFGSPRRTPTQAASRLVGQNVYPFDAEEARRVNLYMMKKEIDEAAETMARIQADQSLSPEHKAERLEEMREHVRRMAEKMQEFARRTANPPK